MSGLANYSIDTTDPLVPIVLINGEPVESVDRVTLDVHVGQIPRLFLERPVEAGLLTGTGIIVQIVPGELPEALDVLNDFFDKIDPGELEHEMLEQFEMGAGIETTGQAAIAVFKKWTARG